MRPTLYGTRRVLAEFQDTRLTRSTLAPRNHFADAYIPPSGSVDDARRITLATAFVARGLGFYTRLSHYSHDQGCMSVTILTHCYFAEIVDFSPQDVTVRVVNDMYCSRMPFKLIKTCPIIVISIS